MTGYHIHVRSTADATTVELEGELPPGVWHLQGFAHEGCEHITTVRAELDNKPVVFASGTSPGQPRCLSTIEALMGSSFGEKDPE